MSFIELFIYSFIQGITEFLPVSSSAHLTLLESFFGWREVGRTFVIAAHLGTLLTVLFYLPSDSYPKSGEQSDVFVVSSSSSTSSSGTSGLLGSSGVSVSPPSPTSSP